jgi:hypothetical protein
MSCHSPRTAVALLVCVLLTVSAVPAVASVQSHHQRVDIQIRAEVAEALVPTVHST